LGQDEARKEYEEAARSVDPWHTTKCPEWTNPKRHGGLAALVALYQMKVHQYQDTRAKAIALKDFMIKPLPRIYREDVKACKSPAEVYNTLHNRTLLQHDVVAATGSGIREIACLSLCRVSYSLSPTSL
jgi:hypothetical protein